MNYIALPKATLAILAKLASDGFMSQESIDRHVFYGVADEHLLGTMLREMKRDGLLHVITNGCYRITEKGRVHLERSIADRADGGDV